MTNTERVQYAPKNDKGRWYGTVQRRFTANDNGTDRELTVVRFGQPWGDSGPEHFMDTRNLERLSYQSTVLVEHDDYPSPEESAIALVRWVREESGGIFVDVNGSDGYTYVVKVTEDETGQLVAEATDAYETERKK